MPTHDDYVGFLRSHGLTPADVEPILSPAEKQALFIPLLNLISKGVPSEVAAQVEAVTSQWNETTNALALKLTNEYRAKLDANDQVALQNVYAGTFPTRDINGHVARANGWLILLDKGCFEIIEAVVTAFLEDASEDKKIETIISVVQNYCMGDTLPPRVVRSAFEKDSTYVLGVAFTHFAEEFVIGHECGHIVLGHLDEAEETKRSETIGIARNRHKECQADAWAIGNIIRWLGKKAYHNELVREATIVGPFFYLGITHLCECFFDSIAQKASWRDEYPSGLERIIRAYLQFGMFDSATNLDIARKVLRLANLCAQGSFHSPAVLDIESLDRVAINMPYKIDSDLESRVRDDPLFAEQLLDRFVFEVMKERLFLQRPHIAQDSTDYTGKIYWTDTPLVRRALEIYESLCLRSQESFADTSSTSEDDGRAEPSIEHQLLVGDIRQTKGWRGEDLPRGIERNATEPLYLWNSGRGPGIEMVYVPPGVYEVGDPEPEGSLNENMQSLTLEHGFYIQRYPTGWDEYQRYCRSTGATMPERPSWEHRQDHPVVNVTWSEAQHYAQWLGLALPSEPEWEVAARGNDRRVFPWGRDEPDPSRCIWNKHPVYGNTSTAPITATPGGVSPFGAEQMAGNVYEWCDTWLPSTQGVPPGHYRVVKGGSWSSDILECRTFHRFRARPDFRRDELGFRCLLRLDARGPAQIKPRGVVSAVTSVESVSPPPELAERFFEAIDAYDVGSVAEMLKFAPNLASARDARGLSPLHRAARFAYLETNVEIARLLLSVGADPNARDTGQYTPLHYAVVRPQWFGLDFISALLEAGADGHAKCETGERPVDAAARWSRAFGDEALAMLQEFGFRR
jgi:iron(II)-dependent oxidoreductase